jgi:hypothetical protein
MQQLLGSIIVALAIIAVTIALVTAKLGPNAEEDGRGGDRQEQQDNSGRGGDEDR